MKKNKLHVVKPVYETDEEDISFAIEEFCRSHTKIETVEDGAKIDDFIICDLQETDLTGNPLIGQKIEKQFLPLLISALCFFVIVSVAPITRGEHLFSMWIVFPILTSLFFIQVIPKIFDAKNKFSSNQKEKLIKIITILIIIILLVNLGFSYKLFLMIEYDDKTYDGILEEIQKIFVEKKSVRLVDNLSLEVKEVLGKQPDIQNSYVMACLLYTSPSPRDLSTSRMPSSA